ncbi:MAG: ester cyclase [Candidatus Kariarchaeaceae archaeon]
MEQHLFKDITKVATTFIKIFETRNLNILDTIIHPDFTPIQRFKTPAIIYPREELTGIEGMKEVIKGFLVAFDNCEITIHSVLEGENIVLMNYTFEGDHSGPYFGIQKTGNRIYQEGFHLFEFEDMKIKSTSYLWDTLKLFIDLGSAVFERGEKDKIKDYLKTLQEMKILPDTDLEFKLL